eukprot:evm.model.scf_271.2 EVM.evm.TU.scf_271.2   scf_271:21745-25482(+)
MVCPKALGACTLALLLLLQPRAALGDALDDLIGGVEDVVNLVARSAAETFKDRFPTVAACECSRHACDGQFDTGGTCNQELGDSALCGGCAGQKLDFQNSLILTPPSADNGNMEPGVKDSICTFRGMDEVFAQAKEEFGISAWTYIATTDGVMRYFGKNVDVRDMPLKALWLNLDITAGREFHREGNSELL